MLKYTSTQIVFREIPDEISLAINISGCPCACKGCHSSYLAQDIGTELSVNELDRLICDTLKYDITCVLFMGGDVDPAYIDQLAFSERIRSTRRLKIAWYSGRQELSDAINLANFDYIKLGPYIEERGPLNNPNTNQRLYEIHHISCENRHAMVDITDKFWDQPFNIQSN